MFAHVNVQHDALGFLARVVVCGLELGPVGPAEVHHHGLGRAVRDRVPVLEDGLTGGRAYSKLSGKRDV